MKKFAIRVYLFSEEYYRGNLSVYFLNGFSAGSSFVPRLAGRCNTKVYVRKGCANHCADKVSSYLDSHMQGGSFRVDVIEL